MFYFSSSFSTTPFPLGWRRLECPGLQSKGSQVKVTREIKNKYKQMPLNNITSHSAQIVTHAISFIKSSFIVLTQEETQKTLLVSKPYLSLVLFFVGEIAQPRTPFL